MPQRTPPLQTDERSTYLADEARKCDPDRYLCALLSPTERRDALLGLILFNHELARIPEIVTQPMAGMIRYQWWRDAIDEITAGKPPREHPVVRQLASGIGRGWIDAAALQQMIDAREPALAEAMGGDPAELERFVAATSGSLQDATYAALGGLEPAEAAAAREIGTAFGLIGIVRAVAHEALVRPQEPTAPDAVTGLIEAMVARSGALLRAGRKRAGRPAREHMPAFLPAALTHAYTAQLKRLGNDPLRVADLARPASAPVRLLARTLLRRP